MKTQLDQSHQSTALDVFGQWQTLRIQLPIPLQLDCRFAVTWAISNTIELSRPTCLTLEDTYMVNKGLPVSNQLLTSILNNSLDRN